MFCLGISESEHHLSIVCLSLSIAMDNDIQWWVKGGCCCVFFHLEHAVSVSQHSVNKIVLDFIVHKFIWNCEQMSKQAWYTISQGLDKVFADEDV